MAACVAHVFMMAVPVDQPFKLMAAEEARENVADMRPLSIFRERPGPAVTAVGCLVSEQQTREFQPV